MSEERSGAIERTAQPERKQTEGEPRSGRGAQAGRELGPDELIVVPVRNMVLFPGVVLPMMLGRARSVAAIQEAVRRQKPVGVVLQRDEALDEPGRRDLYEVGTLAEVVRFLTDPEGRNHAVCQGQQRFRLLSLDAGGPFLVGKVELLETPDPTGEDVEARFLALRSEAQSVVQMAPGAPEELGQALQQISSPGMLADMLAAFMDIPPAERQEILETLDVRERLERIATKLGHLADVLELSNKIRQETRGSMTRQQREYYLREQLRAIQRELNEGEDAGSELEALRERILAAGMPEEAGKTALKELARLERMPDSAAEYSMVRTYLEVMTELPWSRASDDRLDLERARRILDEDHHGLQKVKQHVLEYLAVCQLKPEGKRPNLCLVGPPGVGKTSLGRSIARAMGKEFVRISLGGVHDEAEIRGHRRTYVGALPGAIVQGLRKAGTNNPVFMLDEMDKLGSSFQGDPSAALLEVLDPEQNSTFRDNYLGVDFDLSRVLFIGTANVRDQIPRPLLDRFEVVELPGYTDHEKLAIARSYLVKRQLEEAGLDPKRCSIRVSALRALIEGYTREAGVRNLERAIGRLCRHAAVRIASGEAKRVVFEAADLKEVLGAPRFENEVAERTSVPGVATGLAWTPVGGAILFVEATAIPGEGRVQLTGQLGDVMRESAAAAFTLLRARAGSLGIDEELFKQRDVHVHLPAGAIPKDGPSAGVALFVALVSLFTERPVRSDVAMTGEISLRGLVLPVGGIKEKVLGAEAAGIKTVLLPRRNEPDLDDVPDDARQKLRFVPLERVEDALEAAFGSAPGARRGARGRKGKSKGRAGRRKKR